MYLLHWIVLFYISQVSRFLPTEAFSFISACVALASAALIWWAVERPIDRFRQRRVIAQEMAGSR
jgi:peptidoglycan/LPS O-acetylase OafA/YrhL